MAFQSNNKTQLSRRRKPLGDSHLVTEQPAFGVILAGLLFSLFVGLGIRAFLSPQKMKILLEAQLAPISSQVTVSVDTAEVSFAKGWLPRFSLLVRGLKLSSDNVCWYSPMGEIGEIELPVSFQSILRGKIEVREIRISDSKFILRSERTSCGSENSSTHLQWKAPPTPEPNPTFSIVENAELDEAKKRQENPPQVEKIIFNGMSLTFGGTDARTLDFKEVVLHAIGPSQYNLHGYLNLTGEKLLGGALAPAQFDFDFEKDKVIAEIKGSWREGHYHLSSEYSKETDQFTLKGDLKHLPVSEVMTLIAKYGITSQPFDAKQLWASLTFSSQGVGKEILSSPLKIENFKLEGDLGEISTASIEFLSLKPLVYKPFDIEVLHLNLDQLLGALAQPHPSTTVGQLGVLQGQLKVLSAEEMRFAGTLRDLQLIFSARGQKRMQTIRSATGALQLKDHVFSAEVENLELQAGEYAGQLSFSFDSGSSFFAMSLNLERLKLSPEIENLATAGGAMGSWSGHLLMKVENRNILDLKGNLKSDFVDIEGAKASELGMTLSSVGSEVLVRAQASKMTIVPESAIGSFFKPILNSEGSFAFQDVAGNLRQDSGVLKWSDWKAKSKVGENSPVTQWSSEGGWGRDGNLEGYIRMRDGKQKMEWKVLGNRDQPKLEAK